MDLVTKTSEVPGSVTRLKKKGDSGLLKLKTKEAADVISIHLGWQTRADLDLGCFYELAPAEKPSGFFDKLLGSGRGERSVIDGLQFSRGQGGPRDRKTRQGCYSEAPFVWHTGDDRSGASEPGERILVNPAGCQFLRRMTIYAFIYEGAARWGETDAVVTVRVPGNPALVVEMGKQRSPKTFVAIAGIDFRATAGTDEVAIWVTQLMTFHGGHAECDRAHGWGMQWGAGSK